MQVIAVPAESNYARSFPDSSDLISSKVLEAIQSAARPINLKLIHALRAAQSEMNSQIVLRHETAPTTDFVNLLVIGYDAAHARADSAPVRLRSNQLKFDPIITGAGVALQKSWHVIDRVHNNIQRTIVIEVTEGTSSGGKALTEGWAC